jgi:hypothetical protein
MTLPPTPDEAWYMALIHGTTAVPKSVAKLIDTVGDQIGLFLEPIHIRRKGQASIDVLVSKAKAQAEIAVLKIENKLAIESIQDRAAERVLRLEERRQANIESITEQAASGLPADVSEEPVDEDWVAQFFDHCQDVSNEQMQSVWARMLTGEVARPGTFSLRTLAAVRVMSKTDANLFTRFCTLVWEMPNGLIPFTPELAVVSAVDGLNLKFADFVRLDALGLIRFESLTAFSLEFNSNSKLNWRYHGKLHILTKTDSREIEIGNAIMTDVGQELAVISGSTPNEEYRISAVAKLRQQGWEVTEPMPSDAQ